MHSTKFNDYYSVTMRSDTGAFVTVSNSMNAMGLGEFNLDDALRETTRKH